ncbi:CPA1 family monovalent cation:H+ antiporter [Ancylobacter sp. 3268]|uniref:Na+/H+ antiporter n=1 Tax=Ancylobacter sp. 3268 TaxID=2817752 RepID=UPI002863C175|nr:Na+/H+ antiporter [Ancylobacter sp. 3268]MDR6951135.1 CPA1 family monovalent cation:H+ antiporter [Ancylobacter sp. 3268]
MSSIGLLELVIATLFAAIALQFLANRLSLPPAVALLAGGAILAFVPGLPAISLDPALVLAIFLPPLLMDGAWFIAINPLRQHMIGIGALAVGAVLFTTIVVAVVAHALVPSLPWAACAALGAIVSPPDAVSARAVLHRVRLPRRLSILLEGESLLNDATGLVLFRFAIAASVTGTFSTVAALQNFALLAVGGAAVGVAVGAAWVLLVRRLDDDYLMIAASALVCWPAYMIAESLHLSGVVATVVNGLICGWYQHVLFPASVRRRGTSFWTVMIFLMEALVFMLIGLSLRGVIERVGGFGVVIEEMAVPILLIILAMTAARFVWIFGADLLIVLARASGLRRYAPVGPRGAMVLGWAGMRGVVTLAVALSVPEGFPGRDFILVAAFVAILITVLVQGTTLGAVIRWVRPAEVATDRPRLTMSQAESAIAQAELTLIERRAYDPDGTLIHPLLLDHYRRKATHLAEYADRVEDYGPTLHAHFNLVLEAIASGRIELLRLHRSGQIDEETLQELERDLDLEELSARSNLV